ncbi:Phosphoenolpyruvate carboxykinase [ATP] [Klebsiella aerogenes]|nr:Phosphoenolpyruvate carboxykinase [ATP] [Klebsiella aerogenes]
MIFLAADAFGVLPPVSRLTTEQMQYHFLSGFTSEAGGHRARHYPADADLLRLLWRGVPAASPDPVRQRPGGEDGGIRCRSLAGQHGWNGEGKRLSLRDTRSIISAILNGTTGPLREETIPVFGLAIPQSIPGVDSAVLDPRNGWSSADKWQEKAESLAQLFMDNFKQYSDTEAGARLALAGPQLQKSAVEA